MTTRKICILLAAAACFMVRGHDDPTLSKKWNASIVVTDETGQPVSNATVSVLYSVFSQSGVVHQKIVGATDGSGVFRASHNGTGVPAMGFRAEKEGYYWIRRGYDLGLEYDYDVWNPTISFVLKHVRRPIAMYAGLVMGDPPVPNQACGFDLEKGDWVNPYGAGSKSDMIFTRNLDQKSKKDYDESLVVSFPNKGDGIQTLYTFPNESGSALASQLLAPAGGYRETVTRRKSEHPGQYMTLDFDPNRRFYIRVRTVFDQEGKVKSALYGKVYGDFMDFTYYLNPTANDRDMEFDTKQNLIASQHVTAP